MTTSHQISLRVEVPGGDFAHAPFRLVVEVVSPEDPTLSIDAAELWRTEDARFGRRAKLDTTLAVGRAAAAWAPLRQLLAVDVPDELELSDGEVEELLDGAEARLDSAGARVLWPPELGRGLSAWIVVGEALTQQTRSQGFFDGQRELGLNWQFALDGEPLARWEMDLLATAERPVARLRDRWVLVPPGIARKARSRSLRPLTAIDALGVALTGTTEVEGKQVPVETTGWIEGLRERIADPDAGGEEIVQPADLTATLREYQLRGLRWLERMSTLGLGGCLADDMGLGKTVMLIALHLRRQEDEETAGPTLVACPASLLGNWEREVARFAPGEPVRRYHGPNRTLEGVERGFVITTYGTLRLDAEELGRDRWGLLVADEAQHVKNPRSAAAKALRTIPALARIALTGTPVENNLTELWAILDWTTPGLLGSLNSFRETWVNEIEVERDEDAAARLAKLVRPFLLRRKKSDPGIAPELPPKTETDRPVSLTPEQAKLYETAVRETMLEIRTSEGMARRGLVLKMLTSLKQVCNHPAQYLKEEGPPLADRSGKLEALDELLDTILAEGQAVLVFSQYVTMAKLLKRHLDQREVASQLLHGGTAVRQRERMVERFQEGEVPVFLLSLKAAGTGLNLTRAEHVIHYDRWWNPAVEEQATDRAHRIGQTRPVQVHRLIAEGTIEDRIASLHESKRELADAIVSSGEVALTDLSDDDLADLVELRRTSETAKA